MGHAHHFLSRLDRVSIPHVELALSLYRDEDLLRYIFERAHIPESVETVAISLDHPENGPFVIVTRSGRFVTCLGAGMKTRDSQPIITKGQLEAFAAKRESLRERIALAGGKGVHQWLRRIYEAADQLSKEDFLAISSLQPLYAQQFMALYVAGSIDLLDTRKALLLQTKRGSRPSAHLKEPLLMFWRLLWALGHLVVLASLDGTETLSPNMASHFDSTMTISWPAIRHGFLPTALRGAWAAARMGKTMLPQYKRWYQQADSMRRAIDGATGLIGLGIRHAKLRAEIGKFIAYDEAGPKGEDYYTIILNSVRSIAHISFGLGCDHYDQVLEYHRKMGASWWLKMCQLGVIQKGPYFYEKEEDVADSVAFPMATLSYDTFLLKEDSQSVLFGFVNLFQMVPWVARSAAEDLYPPRDVLKAQTFPWVPEKAMLVLNAFRNHNARVDALTNRRRQANAGPARQGPCPCGSGKKYKRCCEEKDKAKGESPKEG